MRTKLAIIGVGLIGGSLGLCLKDNPVSNEGLKEVQISA